MGLFKRFPKPQRFELHVLEQDETWYQRAYWLALMAKELKAEVAKLREENTLLLRQVNAGEPLTVEQHEFLAMREELNELHKAKAKLDNRVSRTIQVNRSLLDEVEDLRNGIDRTAEHGSSQAA
ncbi:MAG TPA: hypothetical protein PLL25_09500 [Flavobacteriales bacterium]|jgi:hypothetical protein|nr:hypothetical protein [Flavobacteriales bacterium]